MSASRPHVAVIGGGLAGIAAALECADLGARVTLLERRGRLGGLTWSFQHGGRWVDNGQHVFLRCCDEYQWFLGRIGAAGDVQLQDRLDIPVVSPAPAPGGRPRVARLRRPAVRVPAPLHLAGSLIRYRHLGVRDRLALGLAVAPLRRLRLDDPSLDGETFAAWLARHGQSPAAVSALWDLITVPTVNLGASEASLAVAAKVFQTGLLGDPAAADIGWSRVPLGRLHGDNAAAALARSGVEVRLAARVERVEPSGAGFSVLGPTLSVDADAVVVAVPHDDAGGVLPPGAVPGQDRLGELGSSAVVDVHLVYDRPVMTWPLMAGVGTPLQWVFDRTASSGMEPGPGRPQYLAVSFSAADHLLGRRPEELAGWVAAELPRLLPVAGEARLVDSLVTKERRATFRAVPGTARLRRGPRTSWPGLTLAGAWTDTGWPATMEGAALPLQHTEEVA